MSDAGLSLLLAEREIARLLLGCARAIDQRDVRRVRSCFRDGARVDQGDFAGDADALVEWLERGWLDADRSWHQPGAPRIDVDVAAGQAEAETLCIAVHALPRDAAGISRQRLDGLRWLDRLDQRDGDWRIVERRAVVDWTQTLERG